MNDGICCLVNKGNSLNEDILNTIVRTALQMMRSRSKKERLANKDLGLKGEIRTEYIIGSLGDYNGFIFNVTMDWKNGTSKASFVIKALILTHEQELELMERYTWVQCGESRMHEFFDQN